MSKKFLQIIKKLPKSLPAGFLTLSEETGLIPACTFYLPVSMSRNDPVTMSFLLPPSPSPLALLLCLCIYFWEREHKRENKILEAD